MLKSVTRSRWNSNGQLCDNHRPARRQRNNENGLMGVAKKIVVFNDHARSDFVRLFWKLVATLVQDKNITGDGWRHVRLARFDPRNRRIRELPGRHGFARQRAETLRESLPFARATRDQLRYCANTSQARFRDLLHRLRASCEDRHQVEQKSELPWSRLYCIRVFQPSIYSRQPGYSRSVGAGLNGDVPIGGFCRRHIADRDAPDCRPQATIRAGFTHRAPAE